MVASDRRSGVVVVCDDSFGEREPGEVGSTPASGLVAYAVKVGAHRPDGDDELLGDVGVAFAGGDEGEDFAFAVAEREGAVAIVVARGAEQVRGERGGDVRIARGYDADRVGDFV